MSQMQLPISQLPTTFFDGRLMIREPSGQYRLARDTEVIRTALDLVATAVRNGDVLSDPLRVKRYLQLKYAGMDREVFSVVWVDSQNQVVGFEDLAFGTLNAAAVYPREVVKSALRVQASAAIFSHNHPSGLAEPSRADRSLTERLRMALDLIDIRVLDHIVVGGLHTVSFAERGWL